MQSAEIPKDRRGAGEEFFGRRDALDKLAELSAGGGTLVAVVGPPGSGRSRLIEEFCRRDARRARHLGAAELLDDSLWNDMDFTEELFVVDLEASQITPKKLRGRLQALGLPSRQASVVLTQAVPGAKRITLGGLGRRAAEAMYQARRVFWGAAESDDDDRESTARRRLIDVLDGLPGAIEAAAQWAPAMQTEEILELVVEDPMWLYRDRETGEDLPGCDAQALASLGPQARALLEVAAVFGGPFTVEEVRKFAAEEIAKGHAIEGINELLDSHLMYRCSGEGDIYQSSMMGRRFRVYHTVRERIEGGLDEERREALQSDFVYRMVKQCRRLRRRRFKAGGHAQVAQLVASKSHIGQAWRWVDRENDDHVVDLILSQVAVHIQCAESAQAFELLDQESHREPTRSRQRAEWICNQAKRVESTEGVEAARPWWEQGAALLDDLDWPAGRGRILAGWSEMERRSGDLEAAWKPLKHAQEDANRGVRRMGLGFGAANLAERGQHGQARRLLDELQALRCGEALDLECRLWQRVGYGCYYLECADEQRRAYVQALAHAEEIDDPGLRALCTQSLADQAYVDNDFDEAWRRYEEAIDLLRGGEQPYRLAVAQGNLATLRHRRGDLQAAYDHYMESLTLHRRLGSRSYEGVVLFALGALHHEQGQFVDAIYRYQQANKIYEASESGFDRGATTIVWAWLELQQERFGAARELLAEASVILGGIDAGDWLEVVGWTQRLLDEPGSDGPRSISAKGVSGRLCEEIAAALQDGGDDRLSPNDEEYPPLYLRLLDKLLASRDWRKFQISDGEAVANADMNWDLAVGPEARWFQVADEEPVDLSRRSAVRLILDALVELHIEAPEQCMDVEEIFAHGWPGEKIRSRSLSDRVYWAIRTLRDLGLRDLLITIDAGYRLRRDLRVARMEFIEGI